MESRNLLSLLDEVIQEYRANRQWGTAHVYRSVYNSFSSYNKGVDLPFALLTSAKLKDYENHLRARACRWNTVATYMKVLKAVYNRAVDSGLASFVPRLFKGVRTSPVVERKRALEAEVMGKLLAASPAQEGGVVAGDASPRSARLLFSLMFLLRGIPFVDLVYLRKSDLRDGVLHYRRHKTGRPLTVRLTPEACTLIRALQVGTARPSPYLLPILTLPEGTEAAYREYQCALRRFNHRLKQLGEELLGIPGLSSYQARHTWATAAYHCEVHPGIISEAMGHSSIGITEIYLKPFRDQRIDRANRQVIDFVRNYAALTNRCG